MKTIILAVFASTTLLSQTCTTTISTGANVANTVAAAANGSTVCLNNGDYGTVNLFDISRSGMVTIRSTNGIGATITPMVGNSDNMIFKSLTLEGMLINNCSRNIEVRDSTFVEDEPGLRITNNGYGCPANDHGYVIDNTIFHRVQQNTNEGRLSLVAVQGATITNNTFSGVPTTIPSDGIQISGGTDVLIQNNVFQDILQADCGATHCDNLQLVGTDSVTITENFFINGDTFIMAPDGSTNSVVTNNVFDGDGVSYIDKVQFGTAINPIFRHNTITNCRVSFDSKTGEPASSGVQSQNNILINGSSFKTTNGNGCTSCTFTFNLYDSGGIGSNNISGTPTFTGGSTPSTWAGWELTSLSLGFEDGNDGFDMGTLYYGDGVASPSSPTVTTSAASSITSNTATGNGSVSSDGGATITGRGVCWSTSSNPTTGGTCNTAAGTTGSFSASMTGLSTSTLYHYRAYATNSVGTSYGSDTTFTTSGVTPPTRLRGVVVSTGSSSLK
jgi:hypothetical protein